MISFHCSAQTPAQAEAARLVALHAMHVLDTPPDERFDALTSLATRQFDVPVAIVTLIDHDRQWFKSKQGIQVSQTPRNVAFCDHTIRSDGLTLV